MNTQDKDRLRLIEQEIINKGIPSRVNQLEDFRYNTHDDLKLAHQNKEIAFLINYIGDFADIIATKSERIMHNIWLTLPIIMVITGIVLAIIFNKWILLLAIPFSIIGFMAASPYSLLKKPVSGLGALLFIASFIFLEWHWSVIIGTMLFTQIFNLTAREQYRMLAEERALQSETLFCYMIINKYLQIVDIKTGQLISA
jgi:uncharacterized MnhB-related membrane protein